MKHTKTIIAVALLLALLLSACGQAGPRKTEAAQPAPETLPSARQAPDGYVLQPLAAAAGETVPASDAQPADEPAERPAPETVENTAIFNAKFEGDAVDGSGEVVDGVYRFTATETDGEAWHVKLECNYPTVAGRDYRVTYRFHSDVAGRIKFGDFQEFEIQKGDNSVTGILIAAGGTSYLDLQLGMLPPFTIDFTEIEVEEFADEVDYENALKAPVNFEREAIVYEKHDQGYAPLITRSADSISLNYVAVPWETGVWKSRLYVKTGLVPELGARYRITADVSCDEDMPFEVLFNDGDIEKGYGALYGQELTAGEVTTCEAVLIGGSSDGEELVLQFSLGEVPEEATVTVGNLHIERIIDHYTSSLPEDFALDKEVYTGNIITTTVPVAYTAIPLNAFSYTGTDTVYEGHDDGYVVSLEESAASAIMHITQAPASDRGVWKAKLYAATGAELEAGETYRIRFDVQSAKDQAEYEICFDGSAENAYGALYGRSLTAGGTDSVEYVVTPETGGGPLTLRLQLGKTDTTAGNTVTLSNLSVEKLSPEYRPVGAVTFDYGSTGMVREEHYDGIEQTLSTSGGAITLDVSAARADGGVWSSKLLVNTGVTPEAGAKYRVRSTVAATGDLGEFEILYRNADADLYGEQKPLTGAGDYTFEFTAPAEDCGELVLVYQLGNTAADNTITVRDLQVSKVLGETTEAVELPDFAYPVDAEPGDKGSFDLEANEGAAAVLSGDGASAAATVTAPGDDWHVKFYAKPGVELEAGQTYTITMDVTGAAGCTACYKNTATGAEDGFGTETIIDGTVTHTVTAAESGTLEILLKIGAVAADTAVKITDVQVSKVTGESGTPVTLTGFAYPVASYTTAENSFALETNNGAAAALTGDGSSATATVTTPGDDWHIKLYAKPGIELAAGVTYTITMDVAGANGSTVCFKNTAVEGEEGFGTATVADGKVTHTVTPTTGGPLEILLKIGSVPADTAVTVSNIQVQKTTTDYIPVTLSDFAYPSVTPESTVNNSFELEANSGAAAALTGNGSSATATVTTPGDDWNVKLYAKPGYELTAGKEYRITMDVSGATGIPVCYKRLGGEETDYGMETANGGTVTHTVTPSESGTLEILLKIGNVPANTAVTVSNIRIEENGPATENMITGSVGYFVDSQDAEATGTTARVINSTEYDWQIKFYAAPGVELTAGNTYQVSLQVTNAAGCQVGFKNTATGDELGFGDHWIGSDSETITKTITPESSGVMEILVKIGKLAAGTEVTISNVQVLKNTTKFADVTPAGFAYPVTTPESVDEKSFHVETNEGTAAKLSGNGSSSATATVITPGDNWHIKFYAKPGYELTAGKTYRITMDVAGGTGIPVCYKRVGGEETDYGTETANGGAVTHTVTPSTSGTLEILLKLGALADGTEVTVSNIKIAEFTTGEVDATPSGFAYPVTALESVDKNSFELEANGDAAATLTGNGESAEAAVTVSGDDWHLKLYAKPGITLEAGQTYKILMDVTGADGCQACYKRVGGEETDYGTETIGSGAVTHIVTPSQSGTLEILLKLGALPAGSAVKVSNVQILKMETVSTPVELTGFAFPVITPAPAHSFELEANEGAAANLTGDGSSATATVTTPGDDWHIKLYAKTGVELEAGKTYTISMNVNGADGCPVCYKRVGGEETDYGTETVGSGTVTHTVTAAESGTLEILLKLGTVPAGSSVTVRDIAIREVTGESLGDNQMPADLTAAARANVSFWAHEDYTADLSGDESAATLRITDAPADGGEAWKVKLFVETGVTLEAGKHYRISADVSADAAADYEICYNNGAEEKGVGALYGLHASAAGETVVYEAAAETDADLTLQLNLGWAAAPCAVTVKNVKVEEMDEGEAESLLPSFRCDSVGFIRRAVDAGYVTELTQNSSSVDFRILEAPADRNPWNVKLSLRTGFTPKANTGYRVRFDIDAAYAQSLYEVFYDGGSEEHAYGALYEQALSAGKQTVSYEIQPGDAHGELTVQIRLGKTGGNRYHISNLRVEEITYETTSAPEIKAVSELWIHEDYSSTLEKTADKDTVRIGKIPSEGREPWKTKLFVVTGATLEAGHKYRVTLNVKSIVPTPFEVCFNDGAVEKGLGAVFGLIAKPAGEYVEYVTYAQKDTQLVLQLSLGNCSPPNRIILSDVSVKEAGEIHMVSDTIYTF